MHNDAFACWQNILPPIISTSGGILNVLLGQTINVLSTFTSSTDTLVGLTFELRTGPNGTGTNIWSGTTGLIPALTMSTGQTYYLRAIYRGSINNSLPSADVVINT